jgi:hypothetical protein
MRTYAYCRIPSSEDETDYDLENQLAELPARSCLTMCDVTEDTVDTSNLMRVESSKQSTSL